MKNLMHLPEITNLPSATSTSSTSFASRLWRMVWGAAAVLLSATMIHAQQPAAGVRANYGNVPLSFEANHGQTDRRVQFFSRGAGYGLFLTPGEAILELENPASAAKKIGKPSPIESTTLRMKLLGANANAPVAGADALPGRANYFVGSDSRKWTTDVETYKKVSYSAVYPGIDLVYYGNQQQLEYDFVLAPGADTNKIALSFSGATPKLNAQGDLVFASKAGETSFHKPVVYQMAGEARVLVAGAYKLKGQEVGFELGSYDHSKALVIDPVLSYGTFLGGSLDDRGFAIQVDAAGNAYILGDTVSLNFPTVNAYSSGNHNTSNGWVVFVSKLNPTGTALIYSTFVGGVADSHGLGLAIDAAGNAYFAGYTGAGDYPVTAGAFQTQCGSNFTTVNNVLTRVSGCGPSASSSAFLTKLSPAGNSLVYSSFLGGNAFTGATSVAVDAAGEAYIAGNTNSFCGAGPYYPAPFANHVEDCFPTTAGSYQTMINGAFTPGAQILGFLAKFSANGSALMYSTLFAAPTNTAPSGGALTNTVNAIAVDTSGNAYITGNGGYGLPTTPNAFYVPPANSSTILPPYPAYVAKFDPTKSGASSLVYSTFLGSAVQTANASNYANTGTSIVVDASGDAIVAGYANVCGFPTTVGAYQPSFPTSGNGSTGCQDGFVTKVNPTGTGLVWSTLLGSGRNASVTNTTANAVALGANGNVYVALNAGGGTFPLVNALRTATSGGSVVAELDSTGSNLLFSTYLGSYGSSGYGGTDVATGVAVDPNGNMYVTGRMDANTLTIPTTPGALQTTYQGGSYDAFVLKIAPTITSTTALTIPTGTVSAGQPVVLSAKVSGPTGTTAVPTGTVTFLSGSTTLGTGALSAGVATYTAPSLNATTYTITASYPGDTNFAASVSAASTLVVSPVTPTVRLTAPATANAGASVTLSVAVTGATGTPTGTVVFNNGAATLSTQTLASGAASFSTSSLSVGAHSITVSYSGDSIFAAGVTAAQTVTVSLLTPTVTLTAPATAVVGASVTLGVTVAGTGGTPTGSVTFKDGSTTLSTVTLTSGAASYSTTTLAVGAHSITASYSGDSTFAATVSSAQTVTINVAPAITFSAVPATLTLAHGATGTVVITGTPVGGYTGTVTFSCGTLPSAAACTFAPTSLALSGNNVAQSTTLTITTSLTAMLEQLPGQRMIPGIVLAIVLLPLSLTRRILRGRRAGRGLLVVLMMLASLGAVAGLSGCGSSGPTTITTPVGTYSLTVTASAASGSSTLTIPITVQ